MKITDMKDPKAKKDKVKLELTGFDSEGNLVSEKMELAIPAEKLAPVSIFELDPQYLRKMSVN